MRSSSDLAERTSGSSPPTSGGIKWTMNRLEAVGHSFHAAIVIAVALLVGWFSNLAVTVDGPCAGAREGAADSGTVADDFCYGGGTGVLWLLPVAVLALGHLVQRRQTRTAPRFLWSALTVVAMVAVNYAAVELIRALPDHNPTLVP
jgi:hypothetical protein